ncbi:MAG: terminase [Clostridiaceae bacterium]|nr:terminase [Clostridiaceae bacterium]
MAKRIGRQTPTQEVALPFRKSLYKDAVALYEQTGQKALTWQQKLLRSIMAQNKQGLWVHTKYGFSVPRRNGKNEVVAMRELYALQQGEQVLHTAHRTTTSHTAWERLCRILDKAGIAYDSLRATGRERIELPDTGGRIEFRTRTTVGGLGEGFDLLVIDEAQEYTTDQESTLLYTVSDSDNPQTLMCGTPPTPLSSGTVFTGFRNTILSGGGSNAGWAEWSVEELSDVYDVDLWYETNPSLGIILTERAVRDEIRSDHEDFNIQRLGLWIRYNQKSAISATEWAALRVARMPQLTGKIAVGIKYGNDGANVAMSIAIKTAGGKIFIEAIDCQSVRNGNAWILDFLSRADPQAIVIDGVAGQSLLASELKDARIKPAPILPTVKEVITANSTFEQAIYQGTLAHKGQPSLEQVASNCEKRPIGSYGGWGYRSQLEDYDIALLDSVLLAHWACVNTKPPRRQKIRY